MFIPVYTLYRLETTVHSQSLEQDDLRLLPFDILISFQLGHAFGYSRSGLLCRHYERSDKIL